MKEPQIIKGGRHIDNRGTLSFFNDFDMTEITRFYVIEHPDTEILRGWRAHKIEQRWFLVCKGAFTVKLVEIDDWEKPSQTLSQSIFMLSEGDNNILHIPTGYASCIQTKEPDSKMIVFADSNISDAGVDNYLFPIDYFKESV